MDQAVEAQYFRRRILSMLESPFILSTCLFLVVVSVGLSAWQTVETNQDVNAQIQIADYAIFVVFLLEFSTSSTKSFQPTDS